MGGINYLIFVIITTVAKVALCTCVYNRGDYFKEYLWSVENQTFKDFTLYIWNDGSEEDIQSIVDEYKDKIDIVIKNAEPIHNIGTVKSLVVNLALKDKPEYIQMTDSDDLLEPTMLERMVKELESTGADFVVCDGKTFGDEGVRAIKNNLNSDVEAGLAIERGNPFFSWGMFKADVLKEQNFREGMKHLEDWDLYIRLIKAGKIHSIVREELYNYRTHGEQFHKVTDRDFHRHKVNLWEINNIEAR